MDAAGWDARYATDDYVWKAEPNVFLVREVVGLPVGRAVDLASGEGRNAVWLAEQGWDVTGVDFSDVGLDKGRRLATERGVHVEWVCADIPEWEPGPHRYDLVVMAYLQLPADRRRRAMAVAADALAPGGTLLVIAHDTRNLAGGAGGPQDPAVLYTPDDLHGDLDASGVTGLTVEQAETVERPVADADRPALDCLFRARRSAS